MRQKDVLVGFGCLLLVSAMAAAEDDFDATAVFNTRCGACHTVGQGVDVGPDLLGVTERREKEWLVAFIRSSQTVIGSGDAIAGELFETYGRQKMPDHPYTAEQIGQILAYIEAGGPSSEPKFLLASEAGREDVEAGRELFDHGGDANAVGCSSCHLVAAEQGTAGAFLGGALAGRFTAYDDADHRDRALAGALARRRPGCGEALTPEASLALRAYLRQAEQRGGDDPRGVFPILGLGAAVLLIGTERACRGGRGERGGPSA